ncbi:MAG: carboxymuconolactone decarboxylase family protein [Casimicrobiaceae bacterium]
MSDLAYDGSEQIVAGYEPGSGDPEKDQALHDISMMFGGRIPNFHKVLANSQAVVAAFEAMRRNMQKTKLRPLEREIVSVEVSRRTNCHYCLAAHSNFAKQMKMSRADIQAMRTGQPLSDPRHALVQRAAQRLWDTQGRLTSEEIRSFGDQGLSATELIEIIAVIGWYVISTLTNNLARTRIDPEFQYDDGAGTERA